MSGLVWRRDQFGAHVARADGCWELIAYPSLVINRGWGWRYTGSTAENPYFATAELAKADAARWWDERKEGGNG